KENPVKIKTMALHSGTLMLLLLTTTLTYACMSRRKVNTADTVKCRTPLDCNQNTPHVCIQGQCKSMDEVKKQKEKPKDATQKCNNFLDCTPGMKCVGDYCVYL
uniref:Secreted protein n=1 Tax=Parascaris univalens TaxID=6257 RepID=A0A915B932_PARUN